MNTKTKEQVLVALYKLSHIRLLSKEEQHRKLKGLDGICFFLEDEVGLMSLSIHSVCNPARKWDKHSGVFSSPVPFMHTLTTIDLTTRLWLEGEYAELRWELVDFLIHHYQNELRLTFWGKVKNWFIGL